ncbi:type II restriction enzyme methylase subunits [[Clostridium] sordellii]|uniref:hypothetical protein n=1 Tax=Paraclostridium sordellii TaxID=1505 RepID=UPI000541A8FF|nr:hypothetical protein [Paeniclostridium sordellii]CEK29992.1 type II restriction enzyme methylase subunits [[Clostridium] sordellii] [Paeniclostridium sordellii]
MNKVKIMQKEIYWRLKNTYIKYKLKINSRKYRILKKNLNKNSEKFYNKIIVEDLIAQLIQSLGIIIFLYLFDYLARYIINLNEFIYLKKILKFNLNIYLDNNFFTNALIGSIGVAGVFLGLYYSNISSIFTEKYSNAPREIRNLFTNDLIINKNIHNVTRYMVISIMILALNSIGISPGYITVIVMIVSTVKVIITFSIIGKRTYEFSDTYSVSQSIYRMISFRITNATINGYKWNDINIQNHYKKECSKDISILKTINLYNLEEKGMKSKTMLNFMSMNLAILSKYLNNKKYIPYNSFWYKEKYEYKRWYEASDTEVSLALQTGTMIGAIKKRDYFWFEDELLAINYLCLKKFIKDDNIDVILQYISIFTETINEWIYSFNQDKCLKVIRTLDETISEYINSNEANEEYIIKLVDSITLMYTEYIVSVNNLLKQYSDIKIHDYNNYESYKIESLLKLGYPFLNNNNIFKLFEEILNEFKIENKRITPTWYIEQSINKEFYKRLIDISYSLENVYSKFIYNKCCEYLERNKYEYAMVYLSRESEIFNKISISFELLEQLEKITIKYKNQKSDIWSENNILINKELIVRKHKNMPEKWVKCSFGFIKGNNYKSKAYPDILGFCYNNLCEYLINSLVENNFKCFKIGYENFLALCITYRNFIRDDLSTRNEVNQLYKLSTITNPIIEFFEISGYAILLGEFTNQKCWGEYLKTQLENISDKLSIDNLSDIFEKWINDINIKRNSIFLYNHTILWSWKQRFNESVIRNKFVKYESINCFEKIIDTDSDILNKVYSVDTDRLDLNIDPYEIYIIKYLNRYLTEDKRFKGKWNWDEVLYDE